MRIAAQIKMGKFSRAKDFQSPAPRLNQLIGFVPYINTNVGRRNRIYLAPKKPHFRFSMVLTKTTVFGVGSVTVTAL